eukprot:jgi/Mesvir1/4906/Mv11164-RA.1
MSKAVFLGFVHPPHKPFLQRGVYQVWFFSLAYVPNVFLLLLYYGRPPGGAHQRTGSLTLERKRQRELERELDRRQRTPTPERDAREAARGGDERQQQGREEAWGSEREEWQQRSRSRSASPNRAYGADGGRCQGAWGSRSRSPQGGRERDGWQQREADNHQRGWRDQDADGGGGFSRRDGRSMEDAEMWDTGGDVYDGPQAPPPPPPRRPDRIEQLLQEGAELAKQRQAEEEAFRAAEAEAARHEEETKMMKMFGFPTGFDTTHGKYVDDARVHVSGIKKNTKREARQYMNRRGGFNRPLPSERHRASGQSGIHVIALSRMSSAMGDGRPDGAKQAVAYVVLSANCGFVDRVKWEVVITHHRCLWAFQGLFPVTRRDAASNVLQRGVLRDCNMDRDTPTPEMRERQRRYEV